MQSRGSRDIAAAMGARFTYELKGNTPVLTGALRASEHADGVSGGGTSASVTVSTHLPLYASFREHGGTITVRNARVLTDGRRFFGRSVTQAGSHYMQRTREWAAGGVMDDIASRVAGEVMRQAGL
jgi:hypothetical protein